MTLKTMKLELYARCSSDKQENLDRSIPAQLGALKDYTEKNEYIIYKEYWFGSHN